jgi:hypothetical protein
MRHRTWGAALAAALTLAIGFAPIAARASSHSEAPGTAKDRLADDTDLYAWVAPDAPNWVTLVGNWVPLIEPGSGPNFASFDDEVSYWFNIDNVGDAQDHIRYLFRFKTTRQSDATFLYNTGVVNSLTDPHLNVRQTYTVTRFDNGVPTVLGTDLPMAPQFVGPKSMPNYGDLAKAAVQTLSDGSKVFVGPRDDPFFVDLSAIFDLLTIRRPPGNRGEGRDGVGGYDVMTVALQIPKTRLTSDGLTPGASNSVIGLYVSADRPGTRTLHDDGTVTTSGPGVQVSRLGNPLVNEVVIPLKDKDKFNGSEPANDGANFLSYVVDPELAHLLTLLYGIATPPAPRNDLVAVFLTGIAGLNKPANPNQVPCEMLRLNMAIPATWHPKRFGILDGDNAGFPNGRRLTDDVVDIAERVVAGATPFTPSFNHAPNNQLGDGVDFNDKPFLPYFPYVAPPHNPLNHEHHQEADNDRDDHRGWGRHDDRDDATPAGGLEDKGPGLATGTTQVGMKVSGANPASATRLDYSLPAATHVTLRVFDLQGRAIRTLLDQDAAAGSFSIPWDGLMDNGDRAGKGIYFVRMNAAGQQSQKKVVLQ